MNSTATKKDIYRTSRAMLAFNGDYSALKDMGYSFQKLFAGNYMQWSLETRPHLSHVRIWKRQPQVTVDALTNFEGSFFQFLLDFRAKNKPLPMTSLGCIECVKDLETYTLLVGDGAKDLYREQQKALIDYFENCDEGEEECEAPPAHRYEMLAVSPLDIAPVIELIDKGWVSVVDVPLSSDSV
jgi:hypothetical protein